MKIFPMFRARLVLYIETIFLGGVDCLLKFFKVLWKIYMRKYIFIRWWFSEIDFYQVPYIILILYPEPKIYIFSVGISTNWVFYAIPLYQSSTVDRIFFSVRVESDYIFSKSHAPQCMGIFSKFWKNFSFSTSGQTQN